MTVEVLPHIGVTALEQGVAEALQARDVEALSQLLAHLERRAPERFEHLLLAMETGLLWDMARAELLCAAHLPGDDRGLDALIPPKDAGR